MTTSDPILIDPSTINPVLFAAMRANAFWDHDGTAFTREDKHGQDRWAYEITLMLQDHFELRGMPRVAMRFERLVKSLHEKATAELDPDDNSKQGEWNRRYLDEAQRYMETPAYIVYFEDEYAILSLAVALRHIANVMARQGYWQWVYANAGMTGPGVIKQGGEGNA